MMMDDPTFQSTVSVIRNLSTNLENGEDEQQWPSTKHSKALSGDNRHETKEVGASDKSTLKSPLVSSCSKPQSKKRGKPSIFVCKQCEEQFETGDLFNDHLIKHRQLKLFLCSMCDVRFTEKSYFDEHLEKVHLACSRCRSKFEHKKALYEHLRTHIEKQIFSCYLCKRKYERKAAFVRHKRAHRHRRRKKIRYECQYCGEEFFLKRVLHQHVELYHKDELELIDLKQKRRNNVGVKANQENVVQNIDEKNVLQNVGEENTVEKAGQENILQNIGRGDIMLSVSQKNVMQTGDVGSVEQNVDKENYVQHANEDNVVQNVDQEIVQNVVQENMQNLGQENVSKKNDMLSAAEENIMQSVNQETVVQNGGQENLMSTCPVCEETFEIHELLGEHMNTHSKETSFRCSKCDVAFAELKYLRFHFKAYHTKTGWCYCEFCGRNLKGQLNLKRHVRKVHGIRVFGQKKQVRSLGVQEPSLRKDGKIKAFFCPKCDKAFIHKRYLRAHFNRCHSTLKNSGSDKLDLNLGVENVSDRKGESRSDVTKPVDKEVWDYGHPQRRPTVKQIACVFCGKRFVLRRSLTTHMKRYHTREFLEIENIPKPNWNLDLPIGGAISVCKSTTKSSRTIVSSAPKIAPLSSDRVETPTKEDHPRSDSSQPDTINQATSPKTVKGMLRTSYENKCPYCKKKFALSRNFRQHILKTCKKRLAHLDTLPGDKQGLHEHFDVLTVPAEDIPKTTQVSKENFQTVSVSDDDYLSGMTDSSNGMFRIVSLPTKKILPASTPVKEDNSETASAPEDTLPDSTRDKKEEGTLSLPVNSSPGPVASLPVSDSLGETAHNSSGVLLTPSFPVIACLSKTTQDRNLPTPVPDNLPETKYNSNVRLPIESLLVTDCLSGNTLNSPVNFRTPSLPIDDCLQHRKTTVFVPISRSESKPIKSSKVHSKICSANLPEGSPDTTAPVLSLTAPGSSSKTTQSANVLPESENSSLVFLQGKTVVTNKDDTGLNVRNTPATVDSPKITSVLNEDHANTPVTLHAVNKEDSRNQDDTSKENPSEYYVPVKSPDSNTEVQSRVKAVSCPQCKRLFVRNKHMKKHLKFYCGEKLVLCSRCGRKFVNEEALARHALKSCDGRVLECEICGARCTQERFLLDHIAYKHGKVIRNSKAGTSEPRFGLFAMAMAPNGETSTNRVDCNSSAKNNLFVLDSLFSLGQNGETSAIPAGVFLLGTDKIANQAQPSGVTYLLDSIGTSAQALNSGAVTYVIESGKSNAQALTSGAMTYVIEPDKSKAQALNSGTMNYVIEPDRINSEPLKTGVTYVLEPEQTDNLALNSGKVTYVIDPGQSSARALNSGAMTYVIEHGKPNAQALPSGGMTYVIEPDKTKSKSSVTYVIEPNGTNHQASNDQGMTYVIGNDKPKVRKGNKRLALVLEPVRNKRGSPAPALIQKGGVTYAIHSNESNTVKSAPALVCSDGVTYVLNPDGTCTKQSINKNMPTLKPCSRPLIVEAEGKNRGGNGSNPHTMSHINVTGDSSPGSVSRHLRKPSSGAFAIQSEKNDVTVAKTIRVKMPPLKRSSRALAMQAGMNYVRENDSNGYNVTENGMIADPSLSPGNMPQLNPSNALVIQSESNNLTDNELNAHAVIHSDMISETTQSEKNDVIGDGLGADVVHDMIPKKMPPLKPISRALAIQLEKNDVTHDLNVDAVIHSDVIADTIPVKIPPLKPISRALAKQSVQANVENAGLKADNVAFKNVIVNSTPVEMQRRNSRATAIQSEEIVVKDKYVNLASVTHGDVMIDSTPVEKPSLKRRSRKTAIQEKNDVLDDGSSTDAVTNSDVTVETIPVKKPPLKRRSRAITIQSEKNDVLGEGSSTDDVTNSDVTVETIPVKKPPLKRRSRTITIQSEKNDVLGEGSSTDAVTNSDVTVETIPIKKPPLKRKSRTITIQSEKNDVLGEGPSTDDVTNSDVTAETIAVKKPSLKRRSRTITIQLEKSDVLGEGVTNDDSKAEIIPLRKPPLKRSSRASAKQSDKSVVKDKDLNVVTVTCSNANTDVTNISRKPPLRRSGRFALQSGGK